MTLEDGSVAALVDCLQKNQPALIGLAVAQSDAEFEHAFGIYLQHALNELEANRKDYQNSGEDAISNVLKSIMSSPGIISVQRENHQNGHVDLTFIIGMAEPRRHRLAEAKIYNGPQYHAAGLTQLLTRYCTGRETRTAMLSYVKKANIASLVKTMRDHFDTSLPEGQVECCSDHSIQWAFTSRHVHSSGETITVDHYSCNLHHPE